MTLKTVTALFFALLVAPLALAQEEGTDGVKFQYSDVTEAVNAATPDQLIFVDLFATWCGPCKMMDKQVFPLKEVGDYVNANFITVRLDADSEKGKAFMTEHKIDRLPTLTVLNGDGKVVKTQSGMMDDYAFLRFLKDAKGDVPNMDDLYSAHRKDKENTEKMKAILLEAPYFMQTITSETQGKKWGLRITDLFNLYVKTKGIEHMANPTDFKILSFYHNYYDREDQVIDKMARYFQDYAKGVDEKAVAGFITGAHMNYIIALAQECKDEYKSELGRLTSDLLHVYSAVQNDAEGFKMSLEEYCGAVCALSSKDFPTYIEHMNNYFQIVPDITYNDYAAAIEGLYNGMNEKIDPTAARAILDWGAKAADMKPLVQAFAPLKMVIGDAQKTLGETEKAREMYNEAFKMMMESGNQELIQMLQPQIKKRLDDLAA